VFRVAATVGQLNYPNHPSGVGNGAITAVPLPVRGGTVTSSRR
jgi:hypothetical protein